MREINFLQVGDTVHCLYCHKDIPEKEFRDHVVMGHSLDVTSACTVKCGKWFMTNNETWKERVREEFKKKFADNTYTNITAAGPDKIADFWLAHIDTLLGEIEEKMKYRIYGVDYSDVTRENQEIFGVGYNHALDDIKSIINSYRNNKE